MTSNSEAQKPARIVRRRYLIDSKRQLTTTFLTTGMVALLLIVVNIGFGLLRSSQRDYLSAVAPHLEPVLEQQDQRFSVAMVAISVVLVLAVAAVTIVRTHRTAGAVYAVRLRLERLRDGDLQIRLKLRQNDNLQDLEGPFNEMVASLRERAEGEAEALDALAARADDLVPDGGGIAADLRALARRKREV